MVTGETVMPALVGVLLLGDQTRPGFSAVAVTGFVVAVLAALILARFGEPPATLTNPAPATSHPSTPG
jgi:hypothetical protein